MRKAAVVAAGEESLFWINNAEDGLFAYAANIA
jgi:hypothetical protein